MNLRHFPWKPVAAWLAFALVLGSSLLFNSHRDFPTREAVFFFPENDHDFRLKGERRKIPYREDDRGLAELIVREISLGPGSIDLYPLVTREAEIRSVFLRGATLYIDYSLEILDPSGLATAPLDIVLGGIARTVRFNLPAVEEIVFTVNGQELLDRTLSIN